LSGNEEVEVRWRGGQLGARRRDGRCHRWRGNGTWRSRVHAGTEVSGEVQWNVDVGTGTSPSESDD